MLYYNSTDKELKLYNGTGWDPVAVKSTPVVVRAYLSSDVTIGTSWTDVSFDSKSFDPSNSFASGTFTAPADGYYQVSATVNLSGNIGMGSVYSLALFKNGESSEISLIENEQQANNAAQLTFLKIDDLIYLDKDDYILIKAKRGDYLLSAVSGASKSFITIQQVK
jgi:hypothetical protein